MPTININGFEMSVDTIGTGQPLLLLHGMFGAAADWDLLFPETLKGFKLIRPDLRGHGRSTNPSGEFSIKRCAEDVIALVDELDIEVFRAIGLSLGGNALLHIAAQFPDRVEAMVIVSATPHFPSETRSAVKAMANREVTGDELTRMRRIHARGNDQIAELQSYAREISNSHDDWNITVCALEKISARTLIIHGEKDPLYPVEIPMELYKSIPRSSLWIMPDSGHCDIFLDNATSFVNTCTKFLSR